jgi:hypothetical protein
MAEGTQLASYLVRSAEDAGFEPARGCPQHAFQVCCQIFTVCDLGHRIELILAEPRRTLANGTTVRSETRKRDGEERSRRGAPARARPAQGSSSSILDTQDWVLIRAACRLSL